MQTVLQKSKLPNEGSICLLIDYYIGFDSKDYVKNLPQILNSKTELTYSITAFQKEGESTGIYPEKMSQYSGVKITVDEFLVLLNELGSDKSIEDLNHRLLESLYNGNLAQETKDKIKIFL